MSQPRSTADLVRVAVIAGQGRTGLAALRFLRDGLNAPPLALAGLFSAPEETPPRLAVAERALLRRNRGSAAAEWQGLPTDSTGLPPCDVIVDFRAGPPPAGLVARARHGVWQISCLDTGAVAGPVLAGASAIEYHLTRHSAGSPAARLLASAVVQTKVTLTHSQDFACEKMVQVILRELRRLALTGTLSDLGTYANGAAYPGLSALTGYAGRVLRRAAVKAAPRALQPRTQPFALRVGTGDLPDIDPAEGVDIPLPHNTFCADPFLIARGGEVYCFYEEFPYATRRGHITVARLTGEGAEVIGPALTADHHLSFPYLFEHGGELFMVPETIQAGRVEVWRCTGFPQQWELHATALEGERLADPVLFRQGGEWWLFANSCHDSFGDFSSELCLYRTDGPGLTGITPHPLNPVVVGSDCARNAGRVFERDGRLYRLSQDNSGDVYGYGLNLMEITELSASSYSERRVRHVTPEQIPGAIGCHHADAAGGKFVVDVRWPRPPQAGSPRKSPQ